MRIPVTMHWFLIGGIGLFGGILNGSLGVGAAIFMVPCLTLLLGLPQLVAQGTILWIMVPMSLMSAVRYSMKPAIGLDYQMIVVMAVLAVVGANIGSSIAFAMPAALLKKTFAVFIIIVGAGMLVGK